nr:hypothetical protein Iba_chr05cCG9360 [Ipomoea batatas]
MPTISSQVLADTPTNSRDAINFTSSVNTTDVSNVESVAPPINTNVQTSSGVDINNTVVIPPATDDVSNVESVAPPINTNVQTSSGVDINNTVVIPPATDGSRRNSTNTLPLTDLTNVQSTSGIASQRCQYTPTNFRSGGLGSSTDVTKVQSMPTISSQVLADTPTNSRDAINFTSSVNTTGQACRARPSQPFQVNNTNYHIPGQLRSKNLTTETRVATNWMMSNTVIHPVRNLEEEFSATLQDTSKDLQPSLDVSNVESVAPPINTNVQTSSGVDINNTVVIPPATDGT